MDLLVGHHHIPLKDIDAILWPDESVLILSDSLDGAETDWCTAVAAALSAQINAGDWDFTIPDLADLRPRLARRRAAVELIPTDRLTDALRAHTDALDVAAALRVPVAALYYRLRWMTTSDRDALDGAPFPSTWPSHDQWRFYRIVSATPVDSTTRLLDTCGHDSLLPSIAG